MAKVTTVRLDDQLVDRLDRLAGALDRSRSWLIEQAISRYLDEEAWQVAAIQEGLEAYRSGRTPLTAHDQVMDELQKQIAARLGDASSLD